MTLSVVNNVASLNAQANLNRTSSALAKSLERLSSGLKINRGADGPAALVISEQQRAQIAGLQTAIDNTNKAVSLVQTGEGALAEVQSMLQRVRDLAVQFNNGTLSTSDKAAITAEVAQLSAEISRIGSQTKFNNIALLSGGSSITFQVGAADGETITVKAASLFGSGTTDDVNSGIFDFSGTGSVTLASIDAAIDNVSKTRSTFGSVQNRLEHTLNNLASYEENLSASESRIKDVDMASEMVNFTKYQILQQAGTSMLAQANQAPQGVLSLLR